jgi:hypothetical protein
MMVAAAGAAGGACGGRSDSDTTKVAASQPVSPPPVAGRYTVDNFRGLMWLAGQWQGFMPDGSRFFERYRFLDDSTIIKHTLRDSTFREVSDSSRISLRGGVVADDGGSARWVATRLDSIGVDFAPERGARNHFTWAREDSTKWNATLRWTDEQGRPQTVVYALHRFGR